MKKFLNRFRSDRADSIVSTIIVFPLMMMFIVTGVDYSVYMSDRGQVQGIARDAARTVAIMGGNGTNTKATPIQKAYGETRSSACAGINTNSGSAGKAYKSTSTATECGAIKSINSQAGLVNMEVNELICTPSVTKFIGQRVSCTVTWKYKGIPGSVFSFIGSGKENNTRGTSESEVQFTTDDLVNW